MAGVYFTLSIVTMGFYRESVDVNNLEPKGYRVSRSLSAEEIDIEEDRFHITGTVLFSCNVTGNRHKVQVDGEISAEIELMCDRCSRCYTQKVENSFHLAFLPIEYCPVNREEVRLFEKDLEVSYFTGDTMELHDIVREQILLMIPIKSVCNEKCKGICSKCGINLNEGACKCVEEYDERWGPLKKLISG